MPWYLVRRSTRSRYAALAHSVRSLPCSPAIEPIESAVFSCGSPVKPAASASLGTHDRSASASISIAAPVISPSQRAVGVDRQDQGRPPPPPPALPPPPLP